VPGNELDGSGGVLALGDTVLGFFDAVVGAVAQEVHQRVAKFLDDGFVDLGVAADDLKVDLLFGLRGQVADQAGVLAEELVERLHACAHHGELDISGDPIERAGGDFHLFDEFVVERGLGDIVGHRADAVLLEHQLADQVHQRFEA